MKINMTSGHALILHDGAVKTAAFTDLGGYDGLVFTDSTGEGISAPDDDTNFDAYYQSSDDGDTYYNVVHVLAVAAQAKDLPPAEEFPVPDQDEVLQSALQEITPAVKAMAENGMHSGDFCYALNAMKTSAFLYTHWKAAGGSIADAQKAILKSVFHLG